MEEFPCLFEHSMLCGVYPAWTGIWPPINPTMKLLSISFAPMSKEDPLQVSWNTCKCEK